MGTHVSTASDSDIDPEAGGALLAGIIRFLQQALVLSPLIHQLTFLFPPAELNRHHKTELV
jgi:hypothetical protein